MIGPDVLPVRTCTLKTSVPSGTLSAAITISISPVPLNSLPEIWNDPVNQAEKSLEVTLPETALTVQRRIVP